MRSLAASPVSWGIDFADHPDNAPWSTVLDEIAASGLRALELGPVGYVPTDRVRAELEARELTALGTWLVLPLVEPRERLDPRGAIATTLELIAAAGGRHVILIDRPEGERAATAGQADKARRLSPIERATFARNVRDIAQLAADRDLDVTFHPHTATFVEFRDEIDWLLEATASDGLRLCLDTGHLAWSGVEAPGALRDYAAVLGHVHLKDLDRARTTAATAAGLDFWQSIAAGVFCPIGTGSVEFAAVAATLEAIGYAGAATIEQDRAPGDADHALAQLRASIAHLRAASARSGRAASE